MQYLLITSIRYLRCFGDQFVYAEEARQFAALWTEQLTAQVQAILHDTITEGDLGNVALCNRIRLSYESFSDEAADIVAAF
eukprot:scaffold9007_cov109-Skeletonema_marinoi.AAC.2